jgi:branched-chain amino acid transport system ATP-binding protein
MTSALTIENIEVVYNHSVQALRGMSIDVPDGQIVALLGSNGAGKTTTLKAAGGVLPYENGRIAAGRIRFFGDDIVGRVAYQLARVGPGPCARGPAHLCRPDGGREPGRRRQCAGRPRCGRHRAGLHLLSTRLQDRRKQVAGYLSGGEQQMLAIGRALVGKPRLILLDEPSLGLAPLVVKDIFDIIARINREQGVAMLLVEQNAHVALSVAQVGYIMENGRIVINGPTDKLLNDPDVQRFLPGRRRQRRGTRELPRREALQAQEALVVLT